VRLLLVEYDTTMGFSGGCDLLQELVSGCFLIGNDALFLYCIKVSVSLNIDIL
jgi:hypothetical protein